MPEPEGISFDNLIIMVIFLGVCFFIGILGGVIYYQMSILDTELREVDFEIPGGEGNVTHFQDILDITTYPILDLRETLPFIVYFFVFGLIIGLALTAYLSTKNPIFFVLHFLFTLILTYFAIILSNTYKELLQNEFINEIMLEFGVYNLIMFYLPQIFFMTSLIFAAISFANVMKPSTASHPYGINYGGDYVLIIVSFILIYIIGGFI